MSDRRFDVFLSHNSKDKPAVLAIARALQQAGLEPWLDAWYLRGGDRWQHVLRDALKSSTACAFCYGAHGAGDWHELELEVAHDRALKVPNFRLIPVLLPGLPEPFEPTSLPLFLSTLMWVDLRQGVEDAARLEELVVAVTGMPTSPNGRVVAAEVSDVSPYRGLHTFDREHAEFFFGREADVQRLLEKLKASRFLAVVGPSGSGKSSLVRAGLLPALERNGLPGSAAWQVCVLKPGTHPLETLALHLAQLGAPGSVQQIIDQLRESDRALHQVTSLALLGRPDDVRVPWVIDQAEEVFTLCQDEDERAAFLSNLLYAASAPEGRGAVVLTLRADFYPRLADYPRLAQRLGTDQYLVSPLEGQALRDAIEKPAARAGATFEPGVVDTILTDVETQPGAQPLLEHALQELWQRRRGRTLTLAAYQAIGGVAGALAKSADETFAHLTPEQQAIARRALLRLTQPGEGTEDTRRRAEMDELAARPEEQDEVQRVVDALVAARLLTTSGDEQTGVQWVDVAHEALIRGWPRLREWLKEDREYLVMHRRLTEAAHDWQQGSRDPDLLFRGVRLAEAQALAEAHPDVLNPLEREFVAESEAFRDRERLAAEAERAARERRRQRTIVGLAAGLVVALALGALAFWQWRETGIQKAVAQENARIASEQTDIAKARTEELEQQTAAANEARDAAEAERDRAENAEATAEAEKAAALAAGEEARTQAALARESRANAENEARVALSRQLAAQARAHTDDLDLGLLLAAEAFDLNPDDGENRGSLLASVEEQPNLRQFLHGPEGTVRTLAFSPDGSRLAAASDDGAVYLWPLAGDTIGERVTIEHGDRGRVWNVVFSPDGRQFASLYLEEATSGEEATIRFWDSATGAPSGPAISTTEGLFTTIAISPRDNVLATGTVDGWVKLWNRATGALLAEAPTADDSEVLSLVFSPDGSELMSSGDDGTIRFWEPETLAAAGELSVNADYGVSAEYSLDGKLIGGLISDGTLRLWDRQTRLPIGEVLAAPTGTQFSFATFSSDSSELFTWTADGVIQRWNLLTRKPVGGPIADDQSQVHALAPSPDGETLASAGADGIVRLWNVGTASDDRFAAIAGHPQAPNAMTFSPDGSRLLTGDMGGTLAIWDADDGAQLGSRLPGHADRVTGVAFSPDGAVAASTSWDGTVRLWRPDEDWALQASLVGHESDVNSVTFSASGDLIATGADDGTVRLWRATDGTAVSDPLGPMGWVLSVGFNPEGTVVAAADNGGLIQLWDTASYRPILTEPIESGQGAINAIHFISGGRLASAGSDGTIRLWEVPVETGVAVSSQEPPPIAGSSLTIDAHEGAVKRLVGNRDGSLLASSGDDGRVRVWRVGETTPLAEPLAANDSGWQELAFSPDGSRLAFTSYDQDDARYSVNLWDVASRAQIRAFPISNLLALAARSRFGSRLAAGDANGRLLFWDAATGEAMAEQQQEIADDIRVVAFNGDGSHLAAGGASGAVYVWPAGATEAPAPLAGHDKPVSALAFSADGTLLASGALQGTVWVRDITKATPVGSSFVYQNTITMEPTDVLALAFNPDATLLAVTSWRDIVLWDVVGRQFAGAPLKGHGQGVNALAFSPDGRWLASGGEEGTVFLWDMATRQIRYRLVGGGQDAIAALAFNAEGSLLAAGGQKGSVEIWELSTGSPYALGELTVPEQSILSVAFSADGWLTALAEQGATVAWDLSPTRWRDQACAIAGRNMRQTEWETYIPTRPYELTCPDLSAPPDEPAAEATA